jgi:hypothetical protein
VRAGSAVPLAAVLGLLAACRGGSRPEPAAPAAPALPRLVVEVAQGAGAERRGLPGVEVRIVAEAAMEQYLAARETSRRPVQLELRAEASRLEAELARLRTENDQVNGSWMQTTDDDLRARTALAVQRGRSARDMGEARKALLARKRTAWSEAAAWAKAVERAERRLAEVLRLQAEEPPAAPPAPPAPLAAARTGPDGRAELGLGPGRYAALALVPGPVAGAPPAAWVAWVEVGGAAEQRILLDGQGSLEAWPP